MSKVLFKRRTTAEIADLAVEDGALIYNTDNGKTYMDFEDERIQTGGNADTIISTETTEPTDEDIKLWINPDKVTPTGASNVVDSMEGTQTDKSPSVNAVKSYVEDNYISKGFLMWQNTSSTGTWGNNWKIPFNTSDYDFYEIIYLNKSNEDLYYNTGKIPKGHAFRMYDLYVSNASKIGAVSRAVTYESDTSLKTGDAQYYTISSNTVSTDNTRLIPMYAIGYKTGLFD